MTDRVQKDTTENPEPARNASSDVLAQAIVKVAARNAAQLARFVNNQLSFSVPIPYLNYDVTEHQLRTSIERVLETGDFGSLQLTDIVGRKIVTFSRG